MTVERAEEAILAIAAAISEGIHLQRRCPGDLEGTALEPQPPG